MKEIHQNAHSSLFCFRWCNNELLYNCFHVSVQSNLNMLSIEYRRYLGPLSICLGSVTPDALWSGKVGASASKPLPTWLLFQDTCGTLQVNYCPKKKKWSSSLTSAGWCVSWWGFSISRASDENSCESDLLRDVPWKEGMRQGKDRAREGS